MVDESSSDKTCWVCEEKQNPFKDHRDYHKQEDNPENFVTVSWFGATNTDDVHIECWEREN